MKKIGELFQKETKYSPSALRSARIDWSLKPSVYKIYPNSKEILLPKPSFIDYPPLIDCLKHRKSTRFFSNNAITLESLSYLLWASTGIQRTENTFKFRTAPSAGALYPIETYLLVNRVGNLPKGLYHYSIQSHLLEELMLGDFSRDLTMAVLGQKICMTSSVTFIWTAIFSRSKWKYKERAYRYIYLDAGHIAQNLALSATSIDLGSCPIGAFYDDQVNQIIKVDGVAESSIYLSVVGYPLLNLSEKSLC